MGQRGSMVLYGRFDDYSEELQDRCVLAGICGATSARPDFFRLLEDS
jgi:hypothetical protein